MLVFDYPTRAALAEYILSVIPQRPPQIQVSDKAPSQEGEKQDSSTFEGSSGEPQPVWLRMAPAQRLPYVTQLVRSHYFVKA